MYELGTLRVVVKILHDSLSFCVWIIHGFNYFQSIGLCMNLIIMEKSLIKKTTKKSMNLL